LMEHSAVISGWSAVDASSFPAVHKAQGNGVGLIYVLPKIALTIYAIVLLAVQPAHVSTSLLVASLIALAASWATTGLHQLPIQNSIRADACLMKARPCLRSRPGGADGHALRGPTRHLR
jgi:hypothetical protein